ncbi:aminotransferase class V-fold PLP-dependent enzyme [Streptomyces sp. NPDC006458]|uniref:pyridoxal-phosphate-dependent aminotransferase family protein n=1 Tax=Streptomyces sp. NPDC006458 TaxID=3154302 RepID=UPI0033A6EEA0
MTPALPPDRSAPRRVVLMNPGPVLTDKRVRSALAGPDLCHREPEFATLMNRVRSRVTRVCGGTGDFTSVVLTGSGTSAVEAAIVSAPAVGAAVLAIDNGHYGRRMRDIAEAHGIPVTPLEAGWGRRVDLDRLECALAADPSLSHVTVVHHETSTGMLNDVVAVARVAHRHRRQVIVDAVSSVGSEKLNIAADGLDWVAGSANKSLEGMPGVAFVCARRETFAALEGAPRSYSLDLARHFRAQDHAGAPAFTPAVPAFYAFDTALALALEEGVAARSKRYLALAERLRRGLEAAGLQLLLPAEERAVSLTAVRLPEGASYRQLHDAFKAEGFIIYAGQEELAREYFRVSTMGQMDERDIDAFLATLDRFLTSHRAGRPRTAKQGRST